MKFRLYHETKGGHVHCKLFAGSHDGALGKCGDLCMRTEEFDYLVELIIGPQIYCPSCFNEPDFEFVPPVKDRENQK